LRIESVWKQRNLGIEGDVVSCLYEFSPKGAKLKRIRQLVNIDVLALYAPACWHGGLVPTRGLHVTIQEASQPKPEKRLRETF